MSLPSNSTVTKSKLALALLAFCTLATIIGVLIIESNSNTDIFDSFETNLKVENPRLLTTED